MNLRIVFAALVFAAALPAQAAEALKVYGPGGPAPAMQEAAKAFERNEVVDIEPRYAIYRDSGVALTRRGAPKDAAQAFVEFLRSREGAAIFRRWGWKA